MVDRSVSRSVEVAYQSPLNPPHVNTQASLKLTCTASSSEGSPMSFHSGRTRLPPECVCICDNEQSSPIWLMQWWWPFGLGWRGHIMSNPVERPRNVPPSPFPESIPYLGGCPASPAAVQRHPTTTPLLLPGVACVRWVCDQNEKQNAPSDGRSGIVRRASHAHRQMRAHIECVCVWVWEDRSIDLVERQRKRSEGGAIPSSDTNVQSWFLCPCICCLSPLVLLLLLFPPVSDPPRLSLALSRSVVAPPLLPSLGKIITHSFPAASFHFGLESEREEWRSIVPSLSRPPHTPRLSLLLLDPHNEG